MILHLKKEKTAVIQRQIKYPKITTEDFAEFYGALMGDGCIYQSGNTICISGNSKLDVQYMYYLAKIANSLFGVFPHIYFSKNENAIRLIINNTELCKFFVKQGFPKGKKKNGTLCIPPCFFQKNSLLRACIRGLTDTDGGIYHHPHTKIMLDFTSTSPTLLDDYNKGLFQLGIYAGKTTNRLQIYGKKVNSYLKTVGSSNFRNALKYSHYLERGKVPSSREIEILLKTPPNIAIPYYEPVV